MKSVAVFCGAKSGASPVYEEQARLLGQMLAQQEITLVYGGARSGLMGAVATGALTAGGRVIGVFPVADNCREKPQPGLTELVEVADLAERKARMLALSDGFIALPGGSGTLDEMFEVIALSQMGSHFKPCAFLNTGDYYTPLFSFLQQACQQGFIHPDYFDMLIKSDAVADLIKQMQSFVHPHQADPAL